MWAERYDRALDDIFALQDEITLSVVGAIEPSLRLAEIERVKRKRPDSLDAYDLVLQAQPDVIPRMPEHVTKALVLLERALALDPTYALAHAYAASAIIRLFLRGGLHEENRAASIRHAEAAHRAWPGRCACSDLRRISHRHGRARSCRRLRRIRGGARRQSLISPHLYPRQRHSGMWLERPSARSNGASGLCA